MTKPKIYITRHFPGPGIETLRERYNVTMNSSNRVLSKWQLRRAVRGVDVIVCLLTDRIDAQVLDAAGDNLKLVANYAVGYDNIDIQAAKQRDIVVTNTPGVLTHAVAEFTFALALAVARRITEADRFTRANKYRQWEPELMIGMQLEGKTMGIVGLGRIGGRVAKIAESFGMKVIYTDERRNHTLEKQYNLVFHELDTVLHEADFISLHLPLLPTTKHLIDAKALASMKPTAIVINTARGPIIHEQALIQALQNKEIAGAGLDVFEREPIISRQLARLDNVVITPHIGSATIEARNQMSEIVAANVIAMLETGKALDPVNID